MCNSLLQISIIIGKQPNKRTDQNVPESSISTKVSLDTVRMRITIIVNTTHNIVNTVHSFPLKFEGSQIEGEVSCLLRDIVY